MSSTYKYKKRISFKKIRKSINNGMVYNVSLVVLLPNCVSKNWFPNPASLVWICMVCWFLLCCECVVYIQLWCLAHNKPTNITKCYHLDLWTYKICTGNILYEKNTCHPFYKILKLESNLLAVESNMLNPILSLS